tara:strand:- start:326 stop:652 length:327 start_codon:yes stop_codon:yes gene_type:complete
MMDAEEMKEAVLEACADVEDPELQLGLVDLGLIYDVRAEDKEGETHVEIDMTLTSPGCPVGPQLMAAVHRKALETEGVDTVHINLVWSPRWDPKVHASEDARMDMGIF